MKKALIAMIILLIALILAIVLFVVGVSLTRENNRSDDNESADSTTLTQNDENSIAVDGEQENDEPRDIPEPEPEAEPEPEPETETKPEPKPQPKPEPNPQQKPEPEIVKPATYSDYSADDNRWYRVRTSSGSDGLQDGAFKSFANAKAHADTLKDKGYKVYDDNMNCIYVP